MGGMCSTGVSKKSRFESDIDAGFHHENHQKNYSGFSGNLKKGKSSGGKQQNKIDDSYSDFEFADISSNHLYDSGELKLSISRELKPSTPARTPTPPKGTQVSSFLGKAGLAGLEKAVDVLDTLGSSVSNLNNSGFIGAVASKSNKILILAFEVANTIAKGANLLQSLSEENIHYLKKEILPSEGVQLLVSTDMKELLSIAAADKREEFDVFSREVVRFGDLCKDPQWHNLGRFFSKLDSDPISPKQPREEAELTMQELTTLAQHTSELYHELHALDRFDLDYRRKLEEVESLHLPRKGESLMMLHSELKHQRKLVRGLKKKSLWSKSLEEVVEKLVDVVTFIHQSISEAFEDNGLLSVSKENNKVERLGVAGLALHYANLVTQIDNIASRPTSLPPNMRDTLYNGLPPTIKSALRVRLQTVDMKDELSVHEIKAEMEKTLQWLVPVAADTTRAHQGFGWVGEWANTGNEFGKKTNTTNNIIRLQTLYHADKKKMDSYILELVTWLHRLISLVRYRDNGAKVVVPTRSPAANKGPNLQNVTQRNNNGKERGAQISLEDRNLLNEVTRRRKMVPVRSKSQEFLVTKKAKSKIWAFSRSTGSSPRVELGHQPKANVLDILDGLDTSF